MEVDPLESNLSVQPPSPLDFPGLLTPPPPLRNFQFPPWWGYGYFLEPHNEPLGTRLNLTSVIQPNFLKRSSSEILISEPKPVGTLWGWPVHKASEGAGVSDYVMQSSRLTFQLSSQVASEV